MPEKESSMDQRLMRNKFNVPIANVSIVREDPRGKAAELDLRETWRSFEASDRLIVTDQ
jgi:hypothetical protein